MRIFSLILIAILCLPAGAAAKKQKLDTTQLPQPIYDANPEFVDLYYAAWDQAWEKVKVQEGMFQSPYMDEGLWDDTIWIWDTEFMVLFCRYAPDIFPGIESLDNFYEAIHNSKSSSLRIWHPDNPPFFPWVEYEYYKMTGNKQRIKHILKDERFLQRHYEWFDKITPSTKLHFEHWETKLEKCDIGYHWGGLQSGMDNTPREDGTGGRLLWVDALAQQTLSALYIKRLADVIGDKATAKEFAKKYETGKELLNTYYWDNTDGFYYDIFDDSHGFNKVRTPASFWAMLAEAPSAQQAMRMAGYAADPEEFGGKYPWKTVTPRHPAYNDSIGDYWRGAIWLPTAYMSTKALEAYGFHELAHRNSLNLLKQMSDTYRNYSPATIWECYSPSAAKPSFRLRDGKSKRVRPDFCGWSALGPISLFIENVIGFSNIDATKRLVEWHRHGSERQGIRNLRFGSVIADIVAEGNSIEVVSNKDFTLTVNGKRFAVKAGMNSFTQEATDYPTTHCNSPEWLENAAFYQIYPSSFKDSDGNGIGDLPGIISKLDYIKSIGVNAIWLNPIFHSAFFDGGYDVIDFYKVDPRFGTNSDVVTLVEEAHKRGIKVCLDLVAGHTSNQCQWFKQSAEQERNQQYSDYYIWTDEISDWDKKEIELRKQDPNPAVSTRGLYVEANAPRAKYYMKNFFDCQPALNFGFANPDPAKPWQQGVDAPGPKAVRQEIKNILSFWFDKGVDAFRVDMAHSLIKGDPDKKATCKLWTEMRAWKDANYPDKVLIAEWSRPSVSVTAGFDLDFMMHFGVKGYSALMFAQGTPFGVRHKYPYCYFDLNGKGVVKEFVDNFIEQFNTTKELGYIGIPSCNHDYQRPNIGTRNTIDQLKVAMTFFLTMPGVPFVYYGDEIGMKFPMGLPSKEGSDDRSGCRTPMQWANDSTAGFSTCSPEQLYLPIDTEGGQLTVEAQDKDSNSLLNYVRRILALRHATPALNNTGEWQNLSDTENRPYPWVYQRMAGAEKYIVVINPSANSTTTRIAGFTANAHPVVSVGNVTCKNGIIKTHGVSAAIMKVE